MEVLCPILLFPRRCIRHFQLGYQMARLVLNRSAYHQEEVMIAYVLKL